MYRRISADEYWDFGETKYIVGDRYEKTSLTSEDEFRKHIFETVVNEIKDNFPYFKN